MYLLSWSVDSYSPIEEHRLLYRKIKPYHGVGIFILKLQADPINMTTFISSLLYTHNFSSFQVKTINIETPILGTSQIC